ncbi:MAG TPA: c-type cytochrome [Burkholderiaceae bacterium]|nr:c-type cytochrome [Burkholderiaceae bacterium]
MHDGGAAPGLPLRDAMTPTHKLPLAICIAAPLTPACATGDAEACRALYQSRCTACHSLEYNGVGPAHRGVFGRPAAQAKGFTYSDALRSSRLVWTEEALDRWLADPEKSRAGPAHGRQRARCHGTRRPHCLLEERSRSQVATARTE